MTKDLMDAINERLSVRKFTDEPIPEATITRILDAARLAPSAANIQPWKFYAVFNKEVRENLAKAAKNQKFVSQAPVVIVVCAEPSKSAKRFGDRGEKLYCIQDTAAAVQTILLTATGFGLGTCWVGAFIEDEVRKCLDIPESLLPVAIIPIGHPEKKDQKRPARKDLSEVVEIIK